MEDQDVEKGIVQQGTMTLLAHRLFLVAAAPRHSVPLNDLLAYRAASTAVLW